MSRDNRLYHLDTLRAAAILLVLLFHFKIPGFSAGYLGVDLFMLLSGFLMTYTMLYRRQKEGFFNVKSFYWRRFLRIVPSLFLTILASIIIAYLVFAPHMLFRISKEAFYAQTFTSNFYYYNKSGYFDPSAYERLFIHTWSLSVEEQYYIIFGIMMLLSYYISFKKMMFYIFYISVFISSTTTFLILFFQEFTYEYFPRINYATFYLLPYKILLFQVGSILAYLFFSGKLKKIDNFFSYIIILLFIISIYAFGKYEIHPFVASTLVSALWFPLLIPSRITESLGKNKIIKFIAKTSYQTYLVHWPILIIYIHIFYRPLQQMSEKLFLLFISLLSGWLLWKVNGWLVQTAHSPRILIQQSFAILLTSCLLQGIAIADKGAYWRIPQHREHETSKQAIIRTRFLCTQFDKNLVKKCTIKKGRDLKTIHIFGDSHTENLIPGIFHLMNVNVESLFVNACPPISIHNKKIYKDASCLKKRKSIEKYILNKRDSIIFLTFFLPPEENDFYSIIRNMKRLTRILQKNNNKVMWISPIPYPNINLPYCLSAPFWFADSFINKRCQSSQKAAIRAIQFSKLLKKEMGDTVIDTTAAFCRKAGASYRCRFVGDSGKSLFRDGNHLNIEGSKHLMLHIVHEIEKFVNGKKL